MVGITIESEQVGFDGQSLYSTVKYVDVKMNELVGIGPNPTSGHMQVNNTLNLFFKAHGS
jgi:hypothetical protein